MANEFNIDASEVKEKLQDFMVTVFPENLKGALEKVCLKIEADAKHNCPAVDGTLRQSITHTIEEVDGGFQGSVGSNLEYAPYVHQGTGVYALEGNGRKDVPWVFKDEDGNFVSTIGLKPNPFIQDAIEANRDLIIEYFMGVLNNGK